jgi:hypothetical protein
MRIFALICLAAFVVGAASADHVVIGYRTYMATYPFFGC